MAASAGRTWTTGCLAKIPLDEAGDAEYADVLATVPRTRTPERVADFGYEYTTDGRLVQIRNKKPFAWLGQKHYDLLGDAVINDIYAALEERYGLQRIMLPHDVDPAVSDEPRVPVFASPNWREAERLVILSQGSGAVRPGMWARALCINDSLAVGTIFTYLDAIAARGWAVIVTNPNENVATPAPARPSKAPSSGEELSLEEACQEWLGTSDAAWKAAAMAQRVSADRVAIRDNETPMDHTVYVWDTMVNSAAAKDVVIIAHSFGGRCTTALVEARYDEVNARVRAIAFTDAINDMFKMSKATPAAERKLWRALMAERSVNWVASEKPLDTRCGSCLGAVEVSSGHTKHEYTSASCCTSVFKFLDDKLSSLPSPQ